MKNSATRSAPSPVARWLTCCVIHDGDDVDVDVSSSVQRLVQHLDDVVAHAAGRLEGLGPRLQNAHVQRLLDHGEAEGEPCRGEGGTVRQSSTVTDASRDFGSCESRG